jgi:hypothetical protein
MIRGSLTGWFPYPFFDPAWEFVANTGIPPFLYVSLVVIIFSAVFYLSGFLIMKLWNKKQVHETPNPNKKTSATETSATETSNTEKINSEKTNEQKTDKKEI